MRPWCLALVCIAVAGLGACANSDPVSTGGDAKGYVGEPPLYERTDSDGLIHPLSPRIGEENRYVMAFGIRGTSGLTWSYTTDTLVQRVVAIEGAAAIVEERFAPGSASLRDLGKWGGDSVAVYRLEVVGERLIATVLDDASYFSIFSAPLVPCPVIALEAVDSTPVVLEGMIPARSATERLPGSLRRHEQLGRTYERLIVSSAGDGGMDGTVTFVFASARDGVVRMANGGGRSSRWIVWDRL